MHGAWCGVPNWSVNISWSSHNAVCVHGLVQCHIFINHCHYSSVTILTRRGKPRPSPAPKFCNKKQLLCQLQYQFQIIHYVMFSHFWPYPTDLIILFLKFYTICWSKVGPYTTVCTLYRELLPWITPVRISLESEILTVWTILTMWTILDKFYQVLVTAN